MKTKDIVKWAREYSRPFRVTDGDTFRLKDYDPGDTLDFGNQDSDERFVALTSRSLVALIQTWATT